MIGTSLEGDRLRARSGQRDGPEAVGLSVAVVAFDLGEDQRARGESADGRAVVDFDLDRAVEEPELLVPPQKPPVGGVHVHVPSRARSFHDDPPRQAIRHVHRAGQRQYDESRGPLWAGGGFHCGERVEDGLVGALSGGRPHGDAGHRVELGHDESSGLEAEGDARIDDLQAGVDSTPGDGGDAVRAVDQSSAERTLGREPEGEATPEQNVLREGPRGDVAGERLIVDRPAGTPDPNRRARSLVPPSAPSIAVQLHKRSPRCGFGEPSLDLGMGEPSPARVLRAQDPIRAALDGARARGQKKAQENDREAHVRPLGDDRRVVKCRARPASDTLAA